MANQSVQPVQINSSSNLYGYNQVLPSGFATINATSIKKKEKTSISSIFNWKKDKIKNDCPSYVYPTFQTYPVQYAQNSIPNYYIDQNKLINYNSIYDENYVLPSSIHATVRYLPNNKQRKNILNKNWDPSFSTIPAFTTYPQHQLIQPITTVQPTNKNSPIAYQHEITYSEQITISPTQLTSQSCKCYTNKANNYCLINQCSSPVSYNLNQTQSKSTECMSIKKASLTKHNSIKGSKSQNNLTTNENKKRGTKFAATVNERFLKIFKRSVKEPSKLSKSRKSILDLDLTAYDLVEEPEQAVNEKSNNLNNSFDDEEDHFENMFLQAKAKQIQHLYKPISEKNDLKKDDTWLANEKKNLSCLRNNKKFNSCRIAGQGMQLFGRTSLSNIEESKSFFKEENSEEEDLNRFDKYAKNFDQLDKTERFINKNIFSSQNSIPNVPAPDYDLDEEQDKSAINIFSRSTSDLDQVKEEETLKKTFSNSTKIFVKSDNSLRIKNQDRLSLPPPPPPPLPSLNKKFIKTADTNSPTSSTYSSFNLSINNSNVKSILKKSNSNLILIDNTDSVERKVKKSEFSFSYKPNENSINRNSLSKVTTFKNTLSKDKNEDVFNSTKPKKQVHFRSSFDDQLIVEHIDHNQEFNEDDNLIYDDILTIKLKNKDDDLKENDLNLLEHKDFITSSANSAFNKNYPSQFNSTTKFLNLMNENYLEKNEETNLNGNKPKLDNFNASNEKPIWENQSSQLLKIDKKDLKENYLKEYKKEDENVSFRTSNYNQNRDSLNEFQSTALVKQNQSETNLGNNFSFNSESKQIFDTKLVNKKTKDKSFDTLETIIDSKNSKSFKENDNLYKHKNCLQDENQQMSPSSSSSTSAYVSLYTSSNYSSSTGSSYSISGFPTNNNSNYNKNLSFNCANQKKVSRSAIIESLNSFEPDKNLDDKQKNFIKQDKPINSNEKINEADKNGIVIDVVMGNYDSLNQSAPNEHIYEELECSFEREINIIDNLNNNLNSMKKSIFEGASRDQILEYLEDAKERVEILINNYNEQYSPQNKISSLSTSCHNISANKTSHNRRNRNINLSNASSDCSDSSDILINTTGQHLERNDSGVGTETSKPSSLDLRVSKSEACLTELINNHLVHPHHYERPIDNKENKKNENDINSEEQSCADCDQRITVELNDQTGLVYYPLLCEKCEKRRTERKEIISEFVDTEFKYGRDLRIIREEFYRPMEVAGLLTKEQLKGVFLNLEELIQVNSKFSEKLQDAIDIATEQGDEDYTTVDIGKLFMESCDMLKSFETYCIKQASASRLLGQLEKDKEFLRIFLRVSQMENVLLRRMNLSAFLMVPVQRVTKYPLLLNRLYKVTPYHHVDREILCESQRKVEIHLEQINQQTKGTVPNKIWRRISNLSNNSTPKRTNSEDFGDIKLKKFNSSVRELFKAFKSRS